jgi:pyrimidine-nucleoside phosphorylase
MEVLSSVGVAMAGQSERLVPADRMLYALRDVTATVNSRPLIAASIMSKKLAEGVDALVLDVKTGNGAFMKTEAEADELAEAMVGIGRSCGKAVRALITDMSQPLWRAVGNSLEVIEAIEVLRGGGPEDTASLCRELAAHCLVLGQTAATLEDARSLYSRVIRTGRAFDHFRAMVNAQGGESAALEDTSLLPRAQAAEQVIAAESGFVSGMDTEGLGAAVNVLGAGREVMGERIDPAVGMIIHRKIGDYVEAGEPLVTLHYNDVTRCRAVRTRVLRCFHLSREPACAPALIRKVVS